jgi:hypothetical protein
MRVLVAIVIGSLLAGPGLSYAQDGRSGCAARCAAERTAREARCPFGGEYQEQARSDCLRASASAYRTCTGSCQTPSRSPPRSAPR